MSACLICRSPEKQDMQQRNPDGWYEEMKKELTEKDPQHGREKQQLELRLRAQDMELQHLRNDINKVNLLVKKKKSYFYICLNTVTYNHYSV